MSDSTYHVTGMTCGGCVASLTRALEAALPGCTVEVELDGGTVTVQGPHDAAQVADAVDDAGFELVPG